MVPATNRQSAVQQPSSAENRASDRIPLQTEVTLGSDSNFYTGFCGNISQGGIFVATYTVVPLGGVLDLEFSLPDAGPPVRVRGQVRWARTYRADSEIPPGLGLRFLDLSDHDRQRIECFVRSRDTLFFEED